MTLPAWPPLALEFAAPRIKGVEDADRELGYVSGIGAAPGNSWEQVLCVHSYSVQRVHPDTRAADDAAVVRQNCSSEKPQG